MCAVDGDEVRFVAALGGHPLGGEGESESGREIGSLIGGKFSQ